MHIQSLSSASPGNALRCSVCEVRSNANISASDLASAVSELPLQSARNFASARFPPLSSNRKERKASEALALRSSLGDTSPDPMRLASSRAACLSPDATSLAIAMSSSRAKSRSDSARSSCAILAASDAHSPTVPRFEHI